MMLHAKKTVKKAIGEKPKVRSHWFKNALQLGSFLLVLFGLIALGQAIVKPKLFLGQVATVQVQAIRDFEYVSLCKTREKQQEYKQRVNPVYNVDKTKFYAFVKTLQAFRDHLTKLELLGPKAPRSELEAIARQLHAAGIIMTLDDLSVLAAIRPTSKRDQILEESLYSLQEIVERGIVDDRFQDPNIPNIVTDYYNQAIPFVTYVDAIKQLRASLDSLSVSYEIYSACFHLMKQNIQANLVYDGKATNEKVQQVMDSVASVHVKVLSGDYLIKVGQPVTEEVYEAYQAYLKDLKLYGGNRIAYWMALFSKGFLLVLLFIWTVLLLKMFASKLPGRAYCAIGAMVIGNFALILLGFFISQNSLLGQQFPLERWVSLVGPTFLVPLLIPMFVSLNVSMVISVFMIGLKALLVGDCLDVFLLNLLIGNIILYRCRKIRFSKDIARAVFQGFILYALGVVVYDAVSHNFDGIACIQQWILLAIQAGITLVLGYCLIPCLEVLFRQTTAITFFRLTNTDHPLLQKLQTVAPGTYHHSLTVSLLAEKASNEIQANSNLCRCCSLYHDIGKITAPSYFIENQQNGENPHQDKLPSISALILKNHVKEGVALARQYKLPQRVIDIIQQHHGTSLMQYFYKKALLMKKEGETVEEGFFRYDGPKPNFKESVIVSLADAIEAASRNLSEINANSVDHLIKTIVQERWVDQQLDGCPLTLQELETICHSFKMTLLTMYHERISYSVIDIKQNAVKPA